jgi:hypothetical protein
MVCYVRNTVAGIVTSTKEIEIKRGRLSKKSIDISNIKSCTISRNKGCANDEVATLKIQYCVVGEMNDLLFTIY